MTHEHSPAEQQPTLVTIIPEINELRFSHPDSHPYDIVHYNTTKHDVREMGSRLAELCVAVGPGETDAAEVRESINQHREKTGERVQLTQQAISGTAGVLSALMPAELFRFTGKLGNPATLVLGEMSVVSAKASQSEITAYKERIAELEKIKNMRDRAELEAIDSAKLDFTTYSHAILTVRQSRFLLEFESPMAILAARVFSHIAEHNPDAVNTHGLANAAWEQMPLAERSLFVDPKTPDRIYGANGNVLIKRCEEIIKLAGDGRMELTRRRDPTRAFVSTKNVSIELQEVPLSEADSSLYPVYPPNTSRDYIDRRLEGLGEQPAISTEDYAVAQHCIDRYVNARGLVQANHEEAIKILTLIMDRAGKQALTTLIEQNPGRRTPVQALARLHAITKSSLGYYRYQQAFRQRTIAGSTPTGDRSRITYTAGYAPTNAPARTTTRWYIGDSFAPPLPPETQS